MKIVWPVRVSYNARFVWKPKRASRRSLFRWGYWNFGWQSKREQDRTNQFIEKLTPEQQDHFIKWADVQIAMRAGDWNKAREIAGTDPNLIGSIEAAERVLSFGMNPFD